MVPEDLRYTDQHEWVKLEGNSATVGITDHAQEALGDITFVELPAIGTALAKGDEACAIESCKAAASVYSPADGEISAINEELEDAPEALNSDAYASWIFKIEVSDTSTLDGLMDAAAYEELLKKEED